MPFATEQAADFARANALSPVVSAAVVGAGGRGAIYHPKDGNVFKLTHDECRLVTPRWDI